MSGYSYWIVSPGWTGVFTPLTEKIVGTHSMNGYGSSFASVYSLILCRLRTMRIGTVSASESYRIASWFKPMNLPSLRIGVEISVDSPLFRHVNDECDLRAVTLLVH